MDPVSLTGIGIGASAAGGLTSALGGIMGGESSSQMYGYQAGVAKVNQQIAKQNADYALATGEVEAQHSGMKTRAEIGAAKAAQGANGLDVNGGSPAAVRSSQLDIGLDSQAIIRSNAAKRAYGFEVEAMQAGAQANIYKMSASKSKTAGYIGAASSLLGSASSVSAKWLDASRVGIGSGGGDPGGGGGE